MLYILVAGALLGSLSFCKADTFQPITKYIVPCGGFGTRMLPFTKAFPKEMIPLMNKPAIQETIEEGLRGGLNQFYIVTKRQKSGIEDHFDAAPEIDHILKQSNKSHLLAQVDDIIAQSQFVYIRQPEQGGTGHAVAMVKNLIQDEYFAVGWPDVMVLDEPFLWKSMIEISQRQKASVLAVYEVPMSQVNHYGVVVIKEELSPGIYQVEDLIEKPDPKESPSNLVNAGRFILSQKIFASLDSISRAANGELQLPDAIVDMMRKGERVIAYKIKGNFYDIGRPVVWLEGTIRYGLNHPDFKDEVKQLIRSIMKDL